MEQTIVIERHDAHVRLYRDWFQCAYRRGGLAWRKQACNFCAYFWKCE